MYTSTVVPQAFAGLTAERRGKNPYNDAGPLTQGTPEARLDRLAADQDLVLRLALRNYEGPEWRRFAEVLAEYGIQVVRAWLRNGSIFKKCAARGMGLVGVRGGLPPDEINDLANETVALAIRAFRTKVLIAKKWDPRKKASLKTYFIGQCLFQFPNVYRGWLSDLDQEAADLAEAVPESGRPSLETLVELGRALPRLTADDPRSLRVFKAMGYTQAEMAKRLGTTAKAIESRVFRDAKRGSQ